MGHFVSQCSTLRGREEGRAVRTEVTLELARNAMLCVCSLKKLKANVESECFCSFICKIAINEE